MFAKFKHMLLRRFMQNLANQHEVNVLPEQVRSIAVWQFGGVGDMLLATPVLHALHQHYPKAEIDIWCSCPQFAVFLSRFPGVQCIHAWPIYDFDMRTLFKLKQRRALRAVAHDMRTQQIDLLVNLHIPKLLDWWAVSWWMISTSQAAYTLGITPDFIRGSIYDKSMFKHDANGAHYTKIYQHLMDISGIACDSRTAFIIEAAEYDKALALLNDVGTQAWVCMHVGGRRLQMEDKMWPMDNFIALAQRLVADGIRPVLIGAQSEQDMALTLCQTVPQALNIIGKTTVGDMAAIVDQAQLLIGHDSGPFHIAVALQTPVVVICGRPDAEPEYLNYDRDDVLVLTAETPQQIDVEQVYQAAKRLLLCA